MEDELRIDFSEIAGKTIADMSVYDDPIFGREVLLRFTDETQLSICIGIKHTIDARYFRNSLPDTPLWTRRG